MPLIKHKREQRADRKPGVDSMPGKPAPLGVACMAAWLGPPNPDSIPPGVFRQDINYYPKTNDNRERNHERLEAIFSLS
jgi:hypothetical protein